MTSLRLIRPFALTGVCLTLLWAGPSVAAADADGDGVPDAAEAVLGTDPQSADTDGDSLNDLADSEPTALADPIKTSAAAKGFEIVSAKVEDNYDPAARKDAPDHLELELANLAPADLADFELYYTVTDSKTGTKESYYRKLDGLVLPKGASLPLHIDVSGAPGHFRANPNSALYRTPNAKVVAVELAVAGFAPARIELRKDEGMEEAD